MTLTFVFRKEPTATVDLTPIEEEQLRVAGERWDGEELSAAERLSTARDSEVSFHGALEIWDLRNSEGELVTTAFFYQVDSGCFFTAGTTDVVAEIIQFGLDSCGPEVWTAINDAAARAHGGDGVRKPPLFPARE